MDKKYLSEEDFLRDYDPNQFERLSLTTDILIFSVSDGIQDNYRKLNEKHFSVLLVKRDNYPFKDKWCLPGGFVGIDESIDEAATRILADETNLRNIYVEQLYTFGEVNRDPRMRVVSTSYMALVDKNQLLDKLDNKASWFNINLLEDGREINVLLDNGIEQLSFTVQKKIIQSTTNKYDYEIKKNNALAFDHAKVIVYGISRLKNKVEYTDIVFNMMPQYFTLGELQQVYEIILGKKLLAPAFRRIIASKVQKTEKTKVDGGHRPSVMYKYKYNK